MTPEHPPLRWWCCIPRCRRITPGELTNRQPAADPFSARSRQLRRHIIKVNKPTMPPIINPSPQLCRDAEAKIHDDKRGQIT
jgi:hypothetical protein